MNSSGMDGNVLAGVRMGIRSLSVYLPIQGCPTLLHLWATLEEELSWATH